MKPIIQFFLVVLLLVSNSCELEEGNPNLTGQWTCTETSEIFLKASDGTSVYTVQITRDAGNLKKYYIDNFYKLGNGIYAIVLVDGYSLSLPKQSTNGFVFEGYGAITADYNLIELSYTADDGGDEIDHVVASYNR